MFLSKCTEIEIQSLLKKASEESEFFKKTFEEIVFENYNVSQNNIVTSGGDTLLMFSACLNRLDLVKNLLDLDPTVINRQNKGGFNALMLSIIKGNLEISEYLLDATFKSGDINAKNNENNTANSLLNVVLLDRGMKELGTDDTKYYRACMVLMHSIIKFTNKCEFPSWYLLYDALQYNDLQSMEIILNEHPTLLFKSRDRRNPQTLLERILAVAHKYTIQVFRKMTQVNKIFTRCYQRLLDNSMIGESEIKDFSAYLEQFESKSLLCRLNLLYKSRDHDIAFYQIKKNIFPHHTFTFNDLEICNGKLHRSSFINAFQANTNILNLVVDYKDALIDITQILKKNTTLSHITFGDKCQFNNEDGFEQFIESLTKRKSENLLTLTLDCLISEKMLILLLNTNQIENLKLAHHSFCWNKTLSEALKKKANIKNFLIGLSSGICEFLNTVISHPSLESLGCYKNLYQDLSEPEGAEVEVIKKLIINNTNLTELILDFPINDKRKVFVNETICQALTKNESLKMFALNIMDNIENNRVMNINLIEPCKKMFLDNYTLETLYFRVPKNPERPYTMISVSANSYMCLDVEATPYFSDEALSKNCHELVKFCSRNKKISKMLTTVNEAVHLLADNKKIETELKIEEAFREAKIAFDNGIIDAYLILGKILSYKLNQYKSYAFKALSYVKENNPCYIAAKYEIFAIIRAGASMNKITDVLSLDSNESNDMTDEMASKEDLNKSLDALPHLLEIKKMEESKTVSERSFNVGDEIDSLATRYVNNGFAQNGFNGNEIELKSISDNPETVIKLLELLKKQKDEIKILKDKKSNNESDHMEEISNNSQSNSQSNAMSSSMIEETSHSNNSASGHKRSHNAMSNSGSAITPSLQTTERSGKDEKQDEGCEPKLKIQRLDKKI